MKINGVEVDLCECEIEFIKLYHPIFEQNLSLEEVGKRLGFCRTTAARIWNDMVAKYPMLEQTKTTGKYYVGTDRIKIKNARRVGHMECLGDDDTLNGQKIVRKF